MSCVYGVLKVGDTFTRWEVISVLSEFKYLCRCLCGREKIHSIYNLVKGKTKSCGCLARELTKIREASHGLSKTKIYTIWGSMLGRAHRYQASSSEHYKERGITVCERWLNFENFFQDMGTSYKEGLWLERKDNDKEYSPENCKWETPSRQCSNKDFSRVNKSGRVGVSFDKSKGKYLAEIVVDKIRIRGGLFIDFQEACRKVDELEMKHLGFIRRLHE